MSVEHEKLASRLTLAVEIVVEECDRFLYRARKYKRHLENHPEQVNDQSRLRSAMLRASLDLSEALSELRGRPKSKS